jgi:hypothetical protein
MTTNTDVLQQPSSPSDGTAQDKPGEAIVTNALVGILVVGSSVIFWNSRALTPDFVDRANADGPSLMLTIGAFAAMFGLAFVSAIACMRRMMITSCLLMIVTWFTLVWTIGSLIPYDFDGRFNPYVRRMDPLASQYEGLAAAKSLPAVADRIRGATTDGRLDRGEAYDILHGETYYAASAEAAAHERAAVRRKVLAP